MSEGTRRIQFIVNPASANGRTQRQWKIMENNLRCEGYQFAASLTTRPLEAIEMTRKAIMDGYDHIIAVGGDGTINEVINGFYFLDGVDKINDDTCFSAIPMGTGSDFSRVLHLSAGQQAINEICQGGREIACDVVSASFIGWQGERKTRCFINIADVGIGSEVVMTVNRQSKLLGGFLSFLIGSLEGIIRFQNKNMIVKVDGNTVHNGTSSLVVVGNGQYFGGGMRIAPEAQVNDGVLDVVVLKDFSKAEFICALPKVYKGAHMSHPKVHLFRGGKVEIACSEDVFLEVDGETPGKGNCSFEVKPADLKIIV